jgi:hypothetical protein
VNIVIARITKTSVIFLVCILFGGILNVMISPSSFIIGEVLAQKAKESEKKEEIESAKEKCISYDKPEQLIVINCKYADFGDIIRLKDPSILKPDIATATTSIANTSDDNTNNEKIWLLYASLKVEKNAILDINPNDVTWLKIIPSKKSPNAIEVDGSLKVDSVKITSWNPKTNDYVRFSEKAKEDASIYTMIPRPYIKIEETATGSTEIINSELAY